MVCPWTPPLRKVICPLPWSTEGGAKELTSPVPSDCPEVICLWIMVDKLQTQYRAPIETITELRPIIHNEYWGGADKYERILNYFGLEEKVTPATDEKITLQKRLK